MRILHTADWHAGRTLRGFERTPEIREALLEILEIAQSERVDLILVAGDLFDSQSPSAEAQAAVYEFFLRAGELGIPCIVIAGNHDSAPHLESVSGLLRFVGVHAVGTLKPEAKSGLVELELGGERIVVAAVPFLSERRLVKAATLLEGDVGAWRQRYREGMSFFIDRLAEHFRPDSINLLMLHTTLEGGVLSGSEHSFHVGNSYSVHPDALPTSAQYVALGHLHRPQQLGDAPPVEYAGSIVQLDFGEAGEQKSVKLIELEPGRRAKTHSLPLRSGKILKTVRSKVDQLDVRLGELRSFPGLLKVVVQLETPIPGLKDRVMSIAPNALAVEIETTSERQATTSAPEDLSPLEAFERYHLERTGESLSEAARKAFLELLETSVHENTREEGIDNIPI